MLAKYDSEQMLFDVESLMQEKLNDYILAIDQEKLDAGYKSILSQVSADCYFQTTWNDKIMKKSPSIFYGLEEVTATGMGPATIQLFKVFIDVIFVDSGKDDLGKWRVLRYSRALKDLFQKHFDRFPCGGNIKIEQVRPLSFMTDENTSDEMRVGGISISMAIA